MLTRPIPATGEAVPVVGLGTWQTFDVGADPAVRTRLQEVLRVFAERGGRLVDSSPMYGRAEGVVGDLAAALGNRSELFIAECFEGLAAVAVDERRPGQVVVEDAEFLVDLI